MNNPAPASALAQPSPLPRLETTALVRVDNRTASPGTPSPSEVVAASANWDTDFRKKLGIERWGWGLND